MDKSDDLVLNPLNSNEIREQLNEIKSVIENDAHPALSPDYWHVYSSLHDELDQLEILLERNMVI